MSTRKADVVDRVYDRLKRRAMEFSFAPGQKLKEGVLAAEFGVSRTPVREALNRLVSEGFMTFVPNRGFYCRGIDLGEIAELYQIRAALEGWAFRRACEVAGDAQLAAFQADWAPHEAAPRFPTLDLYDCGFHRALAALAGNALLLGQLQDIDEKILAFRNLDLQDTARRDRTLEEHRLIAKALAARDMGAGSIVLERHILGSAENAIAAARATYGAE